MAREYGAIYARIWRDRHFRQLGVYEQWTYLMLVTQPDVSSSGVLAVTPARWAQYADGLATDQVVDALATLEAHEQRYVVTDDDYQELLVRSFIKHDKGYTNSRRLPAIKAAAESIASPILRGWVNIELANLGVDYQLADSLSPNEIRSRDSLSNGLSRDRKQAEGYPEVMVTVTDQVTDTVSSSPEVINPSSCGSNARGRSFSSLTHGFGRAVNE